MSKSIWLSKTFGAEAIGRAHAAFRRCAAAGLPYDRAVVLVGYYAERCRQTNATHVGWEDTLAGAERSGWRFASGRNAQNYRTAGERLLVAGWELVGGASDTPAPVLWDMLLDSCPEAAPAPRVAPRPPALRWLRGEPIVRPVGTHGAVFRIPVYRSTCGVYVIEGGGAFILTVNGRFVPGDRYGYYHSTLRAAKAAAEAHHATQTAGAAAAR